MEKYTLILTEKPDAANQIATALDTAGKPRRLMENGVPCYEVHRDKKIVVVPALGHLYTVAAQTKADHTYPALNYRWVPRCQTERGANRIRAWLHTITRLAKDADAFVDACDFDIEGSIIGYCILKYACNGKEDEAKRMRYSTLTKEELEESYEALLPKLDFRLIEAGLARHEIDWLYGINLSRGLTTAAKKSSGSYTALSTGRVQGPTLRFLAARERSIARFVPAPYWIVKAKLRIDSQILDARHEKGNFEAKADADAVVLACKGKNGQIERLETIEFLQSPPPPFELGALQTEAYRFFGYSPMRTSSIAQRLYLDALISYPRTSSQKLPPTIGYEKILRNLANMSEYTMLVGELLAKPILKPMEGKKQDSAHPAIYPTGRLPQKPLIGAERDIYNLIVRRFMAVFVEPALQETIKIVVKVSDEKFSVNCTRALREGWLRFYEPIRQIQDTPLPSLSQGENVRLQKIVAEEKFTKPPARYNPSSVLRKMEQANIGTKATRAGIIQTLYDRKYIREKHIVVTDLGLEVTDVLRRFCPVVVSADFTRQLEERMALVQQGKETKAWILAEAIEVLKPMAACLKENETVIGKQLGRAIAKAKLDERVIGSCPTCQTGKLIVQYSKKTGKRFVGCTNFFNGICKTAFPLPQNGSVKLTGKICKGCGWATVQVWRNRHQWKLCFNPQCPSKRGLSA